VQGGRTRVERDRVLGTDVARELGLELACDAAVVSEPERRQRATTLGDPALRSTGERTEPSRGARFC
jgi:hypothetical protein